MSSCNALTSLSPGTGSLGCGEVGARIASRRQREIYAHARSSKHTRMPAGSPSSSSHHHARSAPVPSRRSEGEPAGQGSLQVPLQELAVSVVAVEEIHLEEPRRRAAVRCGVANLFTFELYAMIISSPYLLQARSFMPSCVSLSLDRVLLRIYRYSFHRCFFCAKELP